MLFSYFLGQWGGYNTICPPPPLTTLLGVAMEGQGLSIKMPSMIKILEQYLLLLMFLLAFLRVTVHAFNSN